MVSSAQKMLDDPRLMARPYGAPPAIRNMGDYDAWLHPEMRKIIFNAGAPVNGIYLQSIWFKAKNNQPIEWSELAAIPWQYRRKLSSLKTANQFYASAYAQKMQIEGIDAVCTALGTQPAQFVAENEVNRRGIVAAYLAAIGDREGIALPDIKAPKTIAAGSVFSEFFKDVGDWISKTTRQVGAAIRDAAAFVMSLRGLNGFATFFIDASGMSLLFSALEQSGAALEAGTWAAFDDQAFLTVVGETMRAAGTVLGTVGMLVPGFGTIAAIIGAASIAAGTAILGAQADRADRGIIKDVKKQVKAVQQFNSAEQQAAEEEAAAAREYADSFADTDATIHQLPPSNILPIAAGIALAAILILGA